MTPRILRALAAVLFAVGAILATAPTAHAQDDGDGSDWIAPGPPALPPEDWEGPIGQMPDGSWCVVDRVDGCESGHVELPENPDPPEENPEEWIADYGYPKDPPEEWQGLSVGQTSDGYWCVMDRVPDCQKKYYRERCDVGGAGDCSHEEAREYAYQQFEQWKSGPAAKEEGFEDRVAFIEDCLADGFADGGRVSFRVCQQGAYGEYGLPVEGPLDWVAGKISEWAANAIEEAAMAMGTGVVWMLEGFTAAFDKMSTIDLAGSGIGQMLALTTALSAMIAVLLLSVQVIKAGVTGQGESLATGLVGLGKYVVILAVYVGVVHLGLQTADAVSDWIIDVSFAEDDQSATEAMQAQLGGLFAALTGAGGAAAGGAALLTGAGLAAAAAGAVIIIAIICMVAIGALWLEMLMRTAGILILIVAMPLVLAGQMSDGTKEWWPKARNALIALIILKPVIVLVFGVGFAALAHGEGLYNVFVGLLIFVTAAFAWPVLAKFLVFTPAGEGSGGGSGLISTLGSSGSSMFGGYRHQPVPAGAGAASTPHAYSTALQSENGRSAAQAAGRGKYLKGMGGFVGVGLQLAAIGKDTLESTAANTAANAGLGSGAYAGRHALVAPMGGRGGDPPPDGAPAHGAPPPEAGPGPASGVPPARSPQSAPAPIGQQTPTPPRGGTPGPPATRPAPPSSGPNPPAGTMPQSTPQRRTPAPPSPVTPPETRRPRPDNGDTGGGSGT